MQFLARLVHADSGSRVVEVSARERGETLGRCLGEASSAEAAEDRARARLLQLLAEPAVARAAVGSAGGPARPVRRLAPGSGERLEGVGDVAATAVEPEPNEAGSTLQPGLLDARPTDLPPDAGPARPQQQPLADPHAPIAPPPVTAARAPESPPDASAPAPPIAQEPPADPEDWSSELAQIDLQLRRLGWQRQQEGAYLERAFGHPSRSRITTYADLIAYLQALQAMEAGAEPETVPVPLRRRDLLSQCDALLIQLAWDANQGRRFLEQHFQLSSRQQLSDTQLLQFNMLLEETLLLQEDSGPEATPQSVSAPPTTLAQATPPAAPPADPEAAAD
jgi:hypothetical protein